MQYPYPILKLEYNQNYYHDNSWFKNFYYVDYYGKKISKCRYKFAKSFNNGFAFVYDYDKKWDIINSIGDSVIHNFPKKTSNILLKSFECISPKDGFFLKNYILVDNILIRVDLSKLKDIFTEDNISAIPEDTYKHGYLVINIDYPQRLSIIEDYSMSGEGLIAIKLHNKEWNFITIESFNKHLFEKKYFEEKFEFAVGFTEGLAKVKKENYFGFIDINGKFLIPAIYDDARSFTEGYAAVAIANCRNYEGFNIKNKSFDFSWNFINKKHEILLTESKYNLTRIDKEKNYYFESKDKTGYTFFWENLDDNYFKARSLKGHYGWEIKSIGTPSRDFWYYSTILGQIWPKYLVDLLTAQNSDELGFYKWGVASWISKDRETSSQNLGSTYGSGDAYIYARSRNLVVETFYIDFDTTQTEFDYINGINSLEIKYGKEYSEGKWKTKINRDYYSGGRSQLDIDWSNYDDGLDMDQQSIDFWNQF
jgi:hypothetical protein